ncbi:hypothetical protein EYF80_053361 [Liparis tanakae]|uniref:Uncharacterized protein n=1 Tax=Liparis tanakae TaxID=230148 RepID=A0A4Z2F6S4_9TELE|nr:hypothetical protein EYF80_053361 [Liparis tanakae]
MRRHNSTQQSDTKRQHLLERLLDAVKQVSHLPSRRHQTCHQRKSHPL